MEKNRNIYSVKQVNSYVKRMFEDDFVLRGIYIRGEISNCKYHYSGHIYFSLKDESGVISAVMFQSAAAGLRFKLEDGMQIVAYGSVSVYERDGRYQLYVKSVEKEGEGDLYRKFSELKERLEEMGMFSEIYKKPIPAYAYKIGIVTAKTGAVIRDIYNVASRRNPYARLFLYPAQVQGEGAAKTIVKGIRTLDKMGLDCIIIGRGGGSIEDLWCFNEEEVAKAVFEAETPVISAVGHETDFTIADFVADLRAPTPSAAAELAVFDYNQFLETLDISRSTLENLMAQRLELAKNRIRISRLLLEGHSPEREILLKKEKLAKEKAELSALMDIAIRNSKERLGISAERLGGLSPLKRLSEGYAYVSGRDGKAVRSAADVKPDENLKITLADGVIDAKAIQVRESKQF